MLVVYCLKDVPVLQSVDAAGDATYHGEPELVAVAATIYTKKTIQ